MAIIGISLPIIVKALNHKSHVSTAIYARISQNPIENAVNTAAKLMDPRNKIHIGGLNKLVRPERNPYYNKTIQILYSIIYISISIGKAIIVSTGV
jgi:hypothetical protein